MKDSMKWLSLQQLLDSALPIGGFSHSFGLESLVQDGRIDNSAKLYEYVSTMLLQSWATSDAQLVRAVYRDAPAEQWDRLWRLERQLHVQRIASETRGGVEKLGRRLVLLARKLHPDMRWEEIFAGLASGACLATHPLAHGYICWQLSIPLEQALQSYFYTCIVTSVNSALRLMSIGQTEGQVLIARLSELIDHGVAAAEGMEPEEAYTNMPLAELAMMRHEHLYSRLFMS
ncbi:urease accessory UreF family protein [Paenibacillus sp. HB172176]|uniref:urease accessory protein UreF n=1 Tax=Paenibacillus sp. HB172176 TaxID=2493690 RepID=UPI00143A1472|nr:urease accessory UreF family protein [Paenibacillus sp. HB172176]